MLVTLTGERGGDGALIERKGGGEGFSSASLRKGDGEWALQGSVNAQF